jgi:hypothetical protein
MLLSLWLLSSVSARFTTGSSTSTQAFVAKFDVDSKSMYSETFDFTNFKPGDKQSDIIQVYLNNKSEVAVRYKFIFEIIGDIPLTLQSKENLVSEEQEGFTYWYTPEPVPTDSESTYNFDLIWPVEENSYAYSSGIASITVTVQIVQED